MFYEGMTIHCVIDSTKLFIYKLSDILNAGGYEWVDKEKRWKESERTCRESLRPWRWNFRVRLFI